MNHIPNVPRREPERESRSRPGPPGSSGPSDLRPLKKQREPIFSLPGAVVVMLLLLVAIQVARGTLPIWRDETVLVYFAFIPARYAENGFAYPGGLGAQAWTFVTYALLHGNWMHLIANCVWLVAFGSAVARRFGAVRFFLFAAVAAAGGAVLHLAVHFGEAIPVVGASAAIAGLMAAAARFVFDAGGPIGVGSASSVAYRRRARGLAATFSNPTALAFIAIFFAINLFVGFGSSVTGGLSIAWEAHLGGFLVGLFAFSLFDPVPR